MTAIPESYAGFVDGAANHLVPLSVGIELTDGCNLDCRHCYKTGHVRKSGELSAGEWSAVLDSLATVGTLFVTFTGGEVFTRPDALEICEAARKMGFAVRIFTNGTLIDESTAERIAGLNALSVEVSIYADEAGLHDYVTRTPGSFARAISAAKMMAAGGVPVTVKSPVMSVNMHRLGALRELSAEIGAELRLDLDMVAGEDGAPGPLGLRLDDAGLREVLSDPWMRERFISFNEERPADENDICGAARRVCAISSTGDVYPCNQLLTAAGNLRERPFGEIWRDSPVVNAVRGKRIGDLCDACRLCPRLTYCGRCGALALQEDGDYLGVSSWACRVAAAKEAVSRDGGADEA